MIVSQRIPKLIKNDRTEEFLNRKKKRLEVLGNALRSSKTDIKSRVLNFIKEPTPKNYLKISRSLLNNSTWLTKSTLRLLKPVEISFDEKLKYLRTSEAQYILEKVKRGEEISYTRATYGEIFKTIFYEFEISHLNSKHIPKLSVPEISTSVILVSGVLNEIFSTPAFERGASYIRDKYQIDFDYCPTSGTKSTKENSEMILNHFENMKGKDKPIWFFAFSKGGIDTLHFLKDHSNDIDGMISGLSTVASPILGSDRVNHKVLSTLNKLHTLEGNALYNFFDQNFDILFKEFQKSLSSDFQESWFQKNYHELPSNMFYTALALEAHWYESHVWMMLTKLFFQSTSINDGIVDAERALYPDYFQGINLGIMPGHHLIGTRSSDFIQEALLEAHIVFLNYLGLLK